MEQSIGLHVHVETRVKDVLVEVIQFLGRDFSLRNPE